MSHQLPQAKDNRTTADNHKYFASVNHQSDAKNHLPDEQLETRSSCDNNVEPDGRVSTGREIVEQSIQRRNVLIQKLLNSQIDPPFDPSKQIESIRFVDVTSPHAPQSPQQSQSQTHRRIDENTPPNHIRNDVLSSPVDTHCRSSPKSVRFNPQPVQSSEDDLLAWKCKQQEAYLTGLKRKENEHLKSLAEEWLRRQNKEEEKLAGKMKKCKLLTEALEHALSAIKVGAQFENLKIFEFLERKKFKFYFALSIYRKRIQFPWIISDWTKWIDLSERNIITRKYPR